MYDEAIADSEKKYGVKMWKMIFFTKLWKWEKKCHQFGKFLAAWAEKNLNSFKNFRSSPPEWSSCGNFYNRNTWDTYTYEDSWTLYVLYELQSFVFCRLKKLSKTKWDLWCLVLGCEYYKRGFIRINVRKFWWFSFQITLRSIFFSKVVQLKLMKNEEK